jgi:antitoxin VapB
MEVQMPSEPAHESLRSRTFKSGNSQAVRIPARFRLPDGPVDVERRPDGTLVVRPASTEPWANLKAVLGKFSDDFMISRDQPQMPPDKPMFDE